MLILRQSTSIDIRMGPFVDATDGVTPETGVTLGAADQAEVLKENGAATVAMGGTFAAITGADGWYDYTVATGDVDTVGEVVFVVQDSSVCLPVFTRAMVVEEAVYDALYDAGAGGPLQPTVAGRTLDVTATGAAGIDWGNIENPTTSVDLSGTDIQLCDTVTTNTDMRGTDSAALATALTTVDTEVGNLQTDVTTILADTAELQTNQGDWATATGFATASALTTVDGKIDTIDTNVDQIETAVITNAAGVDIAADIAAIEAQTDDIGVAGAGLTAVPWNSAWDAEVQSEVDDALTAFGVSTVTTAQVNSEVDTALTDIHLDHLLAADYDPASKPGTSTALLNELVESDGGVSRFTVNALEQGPSGSGASAAAIADAVWDEAQADHTTAGTFGLYLDDEVSNAGGGGGGDATAANQTTIINHLTDVKGATWDSSNSLEAIHDDLETVDGVVDTVLVDTADLQANQGNWVTVTGHATEAKQDILDTNVDAILVDTGTTLPATLASLPTATENADTLLNRDMSTGTDSGSSTVRTVRQALRFLRNRWGVSGSTLTVYEEDDSTSSWTATVSTDAAADPVTGNNPAGGS